MSVEREAIRGIKWTAASKLVVQVSAWAVTLVVMRLLAPSDYGLMAMVTVVISLATTIAELGLGSSIVQARKLPPDELAHVAGVVITLNLCIGASLAAGAPLIAWAFGEPKLTPLVQAMSLQFAFSAIGAVPQALMSRDLMFKRSAQIELASGISISAATLLLALNQAGVWSIVLGALAGGLVRTVLLVAFGTNVRPRFAMQGVKQHLRYGGLMTVTRLSWETILQTDVMVASRHLTQAALGSYSVGLHLATLPMQKIMAIVNQVAFTTVARLQDEPQRLRDGLLRAFRLATIVSVPLLWGLSACAPEFVRLVLGPKWEAAILPVQVMSLVIPLRLISGVMWTAVTAVGRVDIFLRIVIIAAFVFPGCFLVGVQWGLTGLALSWPLAWLLNFAIGLRKLTEPIGLRFSDIVNATARPTAAGLPMVAVIFAARALTPDLPDMARLPLMVALGAGAYILVITVLDRSVWADLRRTLAAAKG
jgi:O-antigen/teichoic acid export membrane protein